MAPIDESELISFQASQVLRPYSPSENSKGLKVLFSVWRKPSRLEFNFILHGATLEALNSVVLPSGAGGARKDELWKTTCLEFFFAAADQNPYFEMNLSPSGDWNLYAFDSYRTGMRPENAGDVALLKVERAASGDTIIWQGSLRPTTSGSGSSSVLASLLDSRSGLVLGAAAVMEYKSGEKDYWALSHAGEKPDFHLRESFRLAL